MIKRLIISVALVFTLPSPAIAASRAAARSSLIFQKGREISGTCFAKFHGVVLMNGKCAGLGHRDSLFVTAEKDQCSLNITRSGEVAISAYRGDCGASGLGSTDVAIGKLKAVGGCLVAANARVCLKAGPHVFKNSV